MKEPMNIKIGDRVRCIDASDILPIVFVNPLVFGKEYIVNRISYCKACGNAQLHVGVFSIVKYDAGCKCGECEEVSSHEDVPLRASRFEKSIEKTEYISVALDVKIEEPILN